MQKLKQTQCSENYPNSLEKKCPTDSFRNQSSTRDQAGDKEGHLLHISCNWVGLGLKDDGPIWNTNSMEMEGWMDQSYLCYSCFIY